MSPPSISKFLTLAAAVLVPLAVSCSPQSPQGEGKKVEETPTAVMADLIPLTGQRGARLVWLEEIPGKPESVAPGDPAVPNSSGLASSRLVRVTGYDAADGLGVRLFTEEAGDYARPLITDDGKSVVYSRLGITAPAADGGKPTYTPEIFIRGWEAGPVVRSLGQGMAVDLWRDPVDGKQYIYAVESLQPGTADQPGRLTGEKLMRFTPEKPEEREILWTATPLGTEQFQLSRDGRRAAGVFPFPKAGLADLTTQVLTPLAAGAWPAGAADDSYVAAVLDGSRRRLRFFAPNLDPGWELTFMGAPGWKDGGLLHPRWSNDPGLLVFTGPLADGDTAGNVSVVRFREDLRSIESVLQVSQGRAARSPDLWVESGAAGLTGLPQQPVVAPRPEPRPWPAPPEELVFAWDHAKRQEPLPKAPALLTPHGFARWGRFNAMELADGWFEADPAAAGAVAAACAKSQAWSMELILTERPAAPPVSVRLAALMLEDGREAFALYRVDRKLVLRVLLGGTAERPEAVVHPAVLTNLAIEAGRPVHLALSLRNNRLACWLDGQMQKEFQLASSGLAAWGPGKLIFGDPKPYGSSWSGTIERVAIWSRALGDDELRGLAETAAQWIQPRTKPTRYKIKAVLASLPPEPAPGTEQLMGVSVWEVKQVLMGQVEARRIAVAGWSRLHGAVVPSTLPAAGEEADLWLESWEDHPELESIPRALPSGADQLPLYLLARP